MQTEAKHSFLSRLDRGLQKTRHRLYCTQQVYSARFLPGPKLNVLFSTRADWEQMIRHGFKNTKHDIRFLEFTEQSIQGYDLVVPLTIDAIRFLNTNRTLIPNNPLPIPTADAVDLCDDKLRFHQALSDMGYARYLPPREGELGFPYILKKRTDEWGQNCVIIHDKQQEAEHAALLKDPQYFPQRVVVGSDEFATHMVMRGGKLVRALNIRYSFNTGTPIKGPDKPIWVRTAGCPHLRLFADILNGIGFEGLCCFNYKPDADGTPLIFEVNPRFGNSLSRHFFSFVKPLVTRYRPRRG